MTSTSAKIPSTLRNRHRDMTCLFTSASLHSLSYCYVYSVFVQQSLHCSCHLLHGQTQREYSQQLCVIGSITGPGQKPTFIIVYHYGFGFQCLRIKKTTCLFFLVCLNWVKLRLKWDGFDLKDIYWCSYIFKEIWWKSGLFGFFFQLQPHLNFDLPKHIVQMYSSADLWKGYEKSVNILCVVNSIWLQMTLNLRNKM